MSDGTTTSVRAYSVEKEPSDEYVFYDGFRGSVVARFPVRLVRYVQRSDSIVRSEASG
ncbi:MAG: hypothetical protein OXG35_06100 [Acidobacteria bacterium]|nr:hypothetical protein [Acidobacteriota bacterium]